MSWASQSLLVPSQTVHWIHQQASLWFYLACAKLVSISWIWETSYWITNLLNYLIHSCLHLPRLVPNSSLRSLLSGDLASAFFWRTFMHETWFKDMTLFQWTIKSGSSFCQSSAVLQGSVYVHDPTICLHCFVTLWLQRHHWELLWKWGRLYLSLNLVLLLVESR